MRIFYTVIYYLLLPFILLRLIWRSRHAPLYRQRMQERLALIPEPSKKMDLWVHAVSLGEVTAATQLIKYFQKKFPQINIIVTTTTPTGSAKVQQVFGNSVTHFYMPFDVPKFIFRFLRIMQPKMLVIMETELWPNLLYCCRKKNIPIFLANARLSYRSAKNYQKIRPLMMQMLACIQQVAAQTKEDAKHFANLGMASNKIAITGSLKFDTTLPKDLEDKAAGMRRVLGETRLIWICASTHEGEEELILEAYAQVKKSFPNVLLLLVPRHPDRFLKVAALCKKNGYEVVMRTEDKPCKNTTDIFIGDTIGELLMFYAASDVAFVGGSLVSVGGHNLLEPAAIGVATVTGPQMFNFTEITNLLLAAKALWQIKNSMELVSAIISLLNDNVLRQQMAEYGKKVVAQNKGALEKQLRLMEQLFLTINEHKFLASD